MKYDLARGNLDIRDYCQNLNEDTIIQILIPFVVKQNYIRKLGPEIEELRALSQESSRPNNTARFAGNEY